LKILTISVAHIVADSCSHSVTHCSDPFLIGAPIGLSVPFCVSLSKGD
jgi:hypothetical protein